MLGKSATGSGGHEWPTGERPGQFGAGFALADLVWPWRWHDTGGWRAGEPSTPSFLGYGLASGATLSDLLQWFPADAHDKIQAALHQARAGRSERLDVQARDARSHTWRVRLLAAPPAGGPSDEIILALALLGERTTSELLAAEAARSSAGGEESLAERISLLLHLLVERLECRQAILEPLGVLEGHAPRRSSTDESSLREPQVAEDPASFPYSAAEIPLTVGEHPLGSVRLVGLPPQTNIGPASWSHASDVLVALRQVLAEWSLSYALQLWKRARAFLDVARQSLEELPRSSLSDLCGAMVEVLGADRAHLWVYDATAGVYRFRDQWGFPSDVVEALRVMDFAASFLDHTRTGFTENTESVFEPPQAFGRPSIRRQTVFVLASGGALFVDWFAETVRLPRIFLEAVHRVASLWFACERLAADAEQATRLKADFVATMSHELRTPLNTLMGYTDLLACEEFGPLTEEQRDVLDRMSASARELLDLINATLDFGRMETPRIPVEARWFSLPELLDEIQRELAYQRRRRSLSLEIRVEQGAARVNTDREKLRLVLKNLLSNAVKFTEKGGVSVIARREGASVEIAVRDTGVGIDPAVLPVIFQPFRQGEPAVTRRFGGVGLGLYVVKQLVSILGGSISVESEPSKGSVFTVRIPAEYGASDSAL
ncbi:MAG: hypothetical protein KatS3mg077_2591 [Candidatus Binatia bacterium]|nr:MAG: hypothetical protein KatS3mg077_2591 [Candidatus Binatia bacterium]